MNHPPRHHGQAPRRPNIGITPDFVQPADSAFPRYELKVPYADAVLRAGGLPFVLPYSDDASCVEAYLDRVSGLLVTGGAFDIPPEAYGEKVRDGMGQVKEGRTAFETQLMRGALKRNMPVLGVCGGMQLLNVVLGGTLFQDIGREVPGAREHEQKHDRTQPQHPVEVRSGTLLAEAVGHGQLMVNSTHHQAVARPGTDVTVSAVAPDGVVEAIESTATGFALGVQWHPEMMLGTIPVQLGVYKLFIQRAREHRR
ncbi:gamma-glutamyl-gamma-aminobutyrate hydrolase family protein [Corallococcus sp. H22C18031201]|uniref:gamma-glutamyl-gamma-aminobutyrate hydrolase family protein n=1 Tax=Citreicoccus inhibens TaxID=2849499 RepID=UPI000E744326|nr:gamma-glutamyl-gamma-aminobutyrate hydrolase family protein [Citreicoccus inhibens]MBU8899755.1 gamma-glutamyl-gamma-aminobutyrate hydrolase family protein [Citreicoccus inhibens]RJS19184.1 gamma-glutamyl-gamma-aminobutyrate hydrolase family protein [Corallococcus sp. H22C18031201]